MQRAIRPKTWSAAIAITALGLALASASPASAQQQRGFYFGGAAGIGIPSDSDLDSATTSQKADLDSGFAGAISGGYAYGNGLRAEIELGYAGNDVDSVSGTAASGDASSLSLMLNGFYDFTVDWPVKPFLGIGLGMARVDVDSVSPVAGSSVDDDDTAFAYQGIAGLSYPVNDQLDLTLSYRYFAVPDLGFTAASGASIDSDYQSHMVMVGVRFRFAAPKKMAAPEPKPMPAAQPAPPPPAPAPPPRVEAPPAPAPAPPPPRNFIVFFDWDKADLTQQARGIVRSAAAAARQAVPVRVRLTGHADRSGPRRYNMGLSQRRADTVKAEMIRLGVAAGDISVRARGEEEPLVPTADGVREPQNRRVEIILE